MRNFRIRIIPRRLDWNGIDFTLVELQFACMVCEFLFSYLRTVACIALEFLIPTYFYLIVKIYSNIFSSHFT